MREIVKQPVNQGAECGSLSYQGACSLPVCEDSDYSFLPSIFAISGTVVVFRAQLVVGLYEALEISRERQQSSVFSSETSSGEWVVVIGATSEAEGQELRQKVEGLSEGFVTSAQKTEGNIKVATDMGEIADLLDAAGVTAAMQHCLLSDWVEGVCSNTCGDGTQLFFREILREGTNGGDPCPNKTLKPEEYQNVKPCNIRPCSVDCETSEWKKITDCSTTCGRGTQVWMRDVIVAPKNGGAVCPDILAEARDCGLTDEGDSLPSCEDAESQNCVLGPWTYSMCSATCGGGYETKVRNIVVNPGAAGRGCGALSQTSTCNSEPCPETPANVCAVGLNCDGLGSSDIQVGKPETYTVDDPATGEPLEVTTTYSREDEDAFGGGSLVKKTTIKAGVPKEIRDEITVKMLPNGDTEETVVSYAEDPENPGGGKLVTTTARLFPASGNKFGLPADEKITVRGENDGETRKETIVKYTLADADTNMITRTATVVDSSVVDAALSDVEAESLGLSNRGGGDLPKPDVQTSTDANGNTVETVASYKRNADGTISKTTTTRTRSKSTVTKTRTELKEQDAETAAAGSAGGTIQSTRSSALSDLRLGGIPDCEVETEENAAGQTIERETCFHYSSSGHMKKTVATKVVSSSSSSAESSVSSESSVYSRFKKTNVVPPCEFDKSKNAEGNVVETIICYKRKENGKLVKKTTTRVISTASKRTSTVSKSETSRSSSSSSSSSSDAKIPPCEKSVSTNEEGHLVETKTCYRRNEEGALVKKTTTRVISTTSRTAGSGAIEIPPCEKSIQDEDDGTRVEITTCYRLNEAGALVKTTSKKVITTHSVTTGTTSVSTASDSVTPEGCDPAPPCEATTAENAGGDTVETTVCFVRLGLDRNCALKKTTSEKVISTRTVTTRTEASDQDIEMWRADCGQAPPPCETEESATDDRKTITIKTYCYVRLGEDQNCAIKKTTNTKVIDIATMTTREVDEDEDVDMVKPSTSTSTTSTTTYTGTTTLTDTRTTSTTTYTGTTTATTITSTTTSTYTGVTTTATTVTTVTHTVYDPAVPEIPPRRPLKPIKTLPPVKGGQTVFGKDGKRLFNRYGNTNARSSLFGEPLRGGRGSRSPLLLSPGTLLQG